MTTALDARPVYDVNFADPQVNRDPAPYFHEMRALGPVAFNPPANAWMVSSYEHGRRVLRSDASFAPMSAMFESLYGAPVFEGLDNPRHDELRAIWEPALLRGTLQERWTAKIESVVDELLVPVIDQLRAGGTVDLKAELNDKIPAHVIARLLGIPVEDYERFSDWSRRMGGVLEALGDSSNERAEALSRDGAEATAAVCGYAGEHLEVRRRTGAADDMLGLLANSNVDIPDDEKRATVTMVVFGGQDTTSKLMTLTLMALERHPEQRRMIAADRNLIPQAVEEVLRWTGGPASVDPRSVRGAGVNIGGIPIPEGDTVFVMFGGTNRDPARWDQPDAFDVLRPTKGHLSFGFGVHSCMGVNLARLEMRTWLGRILDEIPEYVVAAPLEFGHNMMMRSPRSIPVAL